MEPAVCDARCRAILASLDVASNGNDLVSTVVFQVRLTALRLLEDFGDNTTRDIRQPEVPAAVPVGEFFVVQS